MHYCFLTLINRGGPLCTTQRLKLEYDKLLSSFAFNFNLRRYAMVGSGRHPIAEPTPAARRAARDFLVVGPDGYCLPRHPPRFEPFFIEFNGTL